MPPGIACIGVIGKHDNPLHVSLFPEEQRDSLEFQFLLSSCLDIFEARLPHQTADHDFGLLQVVDERLAMYGWLTNTGVKFVIIVDMEGKPASANESRNAALLGVRDADFKPAFRALHTAYIRLLRNPFYDPDDASQTQGSLPINSPSFFKEVERIGKSWYPGIRVI